MPYTLGFGLIQATRRTLRPGSPRPIQPATNLQMGASLLVNALAMLFDVRIGTDEQQDEQQDEQHDEQHDEQQDEFEEEEDSSEADSDETLVDSDYERVYCSDEDEDEEYTPSESSSSEEESEEEEEYERQNRFCRGPSEPRDYRTQRVRSAVELEAIRAEHSRNRESPERSPWTSDEDDGA